jgi:hypothetical protein
MEERAMDTKTTEPEAAGKAMPENARQCPIPAQSSQLETPSLNESQKEEASKPADDEEEQETIHPDTLTDRQFVAIDILAQGTPLRVAAKILQIDLKTLYRWRHQQAFEEMLVRRRTELWSEVVERLRGMCHECLNELHEQLHDRYDKSRFRAATTVLKLAELKKATAGSEGPAARGRSSS